MDRNRIPSKSVWLRSEFVRARRLQLEAADRNKFSAPFHTAMDRNFEKIVIEPGESILCDDCGDEIEQDHIHVVAFGRRVACDQCFDKRWAEEPLRWRAIMPDGSLGGYLR
jgi:hypothetical protein